MACLLRTRRASSIGKQKHGEIFAMVTILIITILCLSWWSFRKPRAVAASPFTQRKQWALTLSQPMVDAQGLTGFYDPGTTAFTDQTLAQIRGPLLHQLGFRSTATDDEVRAHLQATLERQWFGLDLEHLSPDDDPRAAMAFACIRTAFLMRCVMLMTWLPEQTVWRVLLLNAQRAQDCFASWEDLGKAFIDGRQQWVAAFRADPLGERFNETRLNQLLAPKTGAWAGMPWRELPALNPTPA